MSLDADIPQLADAAFTILRDLIHERTGVHYENGQRDLLADKLAPRLLECGLGSFLEYYYLLKYDDTADREWPRLQDALAVPETYFWREFDQVRALVEVIVPAHFAADARKPLRIWSAACSTGEEPLSILMALQEAGWLDRRPIEVRASDASSTAIARARQGTYRDRSFRALPAHLRAKYFTPGPVGSRIAPGLLARVNWRRANLLDEAEVGDLAEAEVIFCRNVFIYFSENAVRKTVQMFCRRMPTSAYLCTGSSESLLRVATDFELIDVARAFVYVKRGCERR
jgi:chemotaxis protein methyltransferase CheR